MRLSTSSLQINMMSGAAILTVASLIMAVAPNWQVLILGRALDGIAIGTDDCFLSELRV